MVKRFKHEFQKASGSREMVEHSEGEWVSFDDYDALRDVLRDIQMGASMMLEASIGGTIQRYAAEVKRVSQSALIS